MHTNAPLAGGSNTGQPWCVIMKMHATRFNMYATGNVNGISIYKEYLAEVMEWVALRYQHQALLHTCISAQLEGV